MSPRPSYLPKSLTITASSLRPVLRIPRGLLSAHTSTGNRWERLRRRGRRRKTVHRIPQLTKRVPEAIEEYGRRRVTHLEFGEESGQAGLRQSGVGSHHCVHDAYVGGVGERTATGHGRSESTSRE